MLAALAAVPGRLARPHVQAAVLSVGGAALLVGSVARYETSFQATVDADMAYMTEVTWKPPLEPADGVSATTDAGRSVELLRPQVTRSPGEAQAAEHRTLAGMGLTDRMIRVLPATDACNCHGWVFTGGRYWIGPADVENILADNGYHPVSDPRPGDVAVYREGAAITHTGLVRTGGAGTPVLIESKWGWMGAFLHRPEDTCYGRHYAFYRGPRETHVLAGLGAPSSPASDRTHTVAANWDPISGLVGH